MRLLGTYGGGGGVGAGVGVGAGAGVGAGSGAGARRHAGTTTTASSAAMTTPATRIPNNLRDYLFANASAVMMIAMTLRMLIIPAGIHVCF